jgi:predicted metal-dependent hydrolase
MAEDTVRIGESGIEVRLRRHARATRFVLRVPRNGSGAALTLPSGAPMAAAMSFLHANESWLRSTLLTVEARIRVQDGTVLPYGDGTLAVRWLTGQGTLRAAEGVLSVPGKPEQVAARVRGFLRETARQALVARSRHHAGTLGLPHGAITLRDTRSRWGSCSSEGDLMYSWRLIMAPVRVLDYVAAHEVAHLAEMNHSGRFWAVVERLCPEFRTSRGWLKENGAGLHLFDFS